MSTYMYTYMCKFCHIYGVSGVSVYVPICTGMSSKVSAYDAFP